MALAALAATLITGCARSSTFATLCEASLYVAQANQLARSLGSLDDLPERTKALGEARAAEAAAVQRLGNLRTGGLADDDRIGLLQSAVDATDVALIVVGEARTGWAEAVDRADAALDAVGLPVECSRLSPE